MYGFLFEFEYTQICISIMEEKSNRLYVDIFVSCIVCCVLYYKCVNNYKCCK